MKVVLALLALGALALQAGAQTIATFNSTVGSWEVELFDDKPITVSNFIKYASSGRYNDQIIHRWVPGFVMQGGGYYKEDLGAGDCGVNAIPIFGTIQNESKVGPFRSNAYGTIAMARQGSTVNSASSQWFINLTNNAGTPPNGLDFFAEGYTVFGRVISGTNIINRFFPPPPVNGLYIEQTPFGPMAVLTNSVNLTCNDIITINLSFRRDMNLQMTENVRGIRQIAWSSVAGVTNIIDYSNIPNQWNVLTNFVGTGDVMRHTDSTETEHRYYRVRLVY
jgi:cyclophilin family peptidyl-prolyl cis-trans isomerase